MRRALLGLLFALSGAAALCYEVAWTRHLVLVFGNTTRAVALLLGAYMLGLAVGSEVGGRLADKSRRPALLYAAFELAIAAFALAFPWLVDLVRAAYLGLGDVGAATPVLFLLAFLLLVIPTFCMGTTLPLLARATVGDSTQTGRDVGFLYAANIVGAVAGAAGTGFFLMEAAGVLGATMWAAVVNAAVGVVGFLAFRGTGVAGVAGVEGPGTLGSRSTGVAALRGDSEGPGTLQTSEVPRDARSDVPRALRGTSEVRSVPSGPGSAANDSALARAALASAFTAGFVGLAAQVVWTRLLTFSLQGFTWTFTAILATFLAGLALGGAVFGRMASRSKDPARLLVRLHVGVAVAAAAALWALGDHYAVTKQMWTVAGGATQDLGARHRLMLVLASGVVLFVPSFLMGGCFPVATSLYQRGLADLGARVGRLYAVNTLGCVLGSLVAGFVLQPLLGPSLSAAAVVIAAVVGAIVVARAAGTRSGLLFGPVALLVCGGFLWFADPARPFLLRSHVFSGDRAREVELERTLNGEVCTVSVVHNTRERFRLLYTDEFEAAGTKPEYRYMRMLAHLPVALARDPSRALVICFGTGTTSGSVATHAAVTSLDIVEISPQVLEVADQFKDVNKDVLRGAGRSDLTVNVHIDDGRHFVLRSATDAASQWGVISLEPLMPYTPAAIHFYTVDFYETCRARLAPGGLMCQWIPLQGMSGEDFKKLVAAFVEVFPDSAMFFVDGAVALVGGPDGVELSWKRVAERLSDPRVAADLRDVGFADPARALATWISGGEDLRAFVKDAEPVTDERPVLEFHPIPPGVALPWLGQNLTFMHDLRVAREHIPVDFAGAADAEKARQELYFAKRSGDDVLDGLLRTEISTYQARRGHDQEALEELKGARQAFAQALSLDPGNETARRLHDALEREWWTIHGGAAMDAGHLDEAEVDLRRAVEFRAGRQADVAWTRLAEVRNRAGKFEAALEAACEATRLFPGGLEARAERAFARSGLSDVEGAWNDYERALAGAGIDALPQRFRQDAERARTAYPVQRSEWTEWGVAQPRKNPGLDVDSWLSGALRGIVPGKIPPILAVRILAADFPSVVARVSGHDAPPADVHDEAAALAAVQRLRWISGDGAADALLRWVESGRAPAVRTAAAEALVAVDPGRAADLLAAPARGLAAIERAVEVARAAARGRDNRLVLPLIRLLQSPELELRRTARLSLFALTRGEAPRIDTLDPGEWGSEAYRRACIDVETWWAREQERLDVGR